jgi:hypothetical protein
MTKLIVVLIALAIQAQASRITDADWMCMNHEGILGTNAVVLATAYGKGCLYVGGRFSIAGNVIANRIAKWDGVQWSPLGTGMNGEVRALVCDKKGDLYVGGTFDSVYGSAARYIAKWDGNGWSALGAGINGSVFSIAIDSSGVIYASGSFDTAGGVAAKHIARWDGGNWRALSTGLITIAASLACDRNGILFATGTNDTTQGASGVHVTKWNGDSWEFVGPGFDGAVRALAIDNNGVVFAGGDFYNVGTVPAWRIAKWDSGVWSEFGDGKNALIREVNALTCDSHGNLYIGGWSSWANNYADHFTFFGTGNAGSWGTIVSGSIGYPYAGTINALACGDSTMTYVGGAFDEIKGVTVNYVAKWDKIAWSALGSKRLQGIVKAIAHDRNGNFYVGGDFTFMEGIAANHIAMWDGKIWKPLGSGTNNQITALALDSIGNLYAAGPFDTAGAIPAHRIAHWNGSEWKALGSGIDYQVVGLACNRNGILFAGGAFTSAGEIVAPGISKWNGNQWDSLGSAVSGSGPAYTWVYAISFDKSGNLFIGGDFSAIGSTIAENIAKWDGTGWSALGSGIGTVNAIVSDPYGDLFIGTSHGTLRWNGNGWSALGLGADTGNIKALACDDSGNLYASGTGGGHIAKWDGTAWSTLGSGVDGAISVLSVYDSTMLVGGNFLRAGAAVSPYLAKVTIHAASSSVIPQYKPLGALNPVISFFGNVVRLQNVPSGGCRVELFLLSGKRIVSQEVSAKVGEMAIKLPSNARLVYICRVLSAQGSIVKKLIQ